MPYLIDPIALIAACALAAGPGGTTSCTAARSTGSSSLGITKPSAAVNGDALVAQLTVRSTGAITPPAGWSQIGTTAQDAAGPIEQAVFWHRVDGTEPTTLTFSWAGGNADASGGLVTYKGVDPFIGFDQGGSADDRDVERRHRRDRQPGRPRRDDLGGERDAAGRLRRRERRHRHPDRRPGPRPGVDRRLDRWRQGHRRLRGRRPGRGGRIGEQDCHVGHELTLGRAPLRPQERSRRRLRHGRGLLHDRVGLEDRVDADAHLHTGRRQHGERRCLVRRARRAGRRRRRRPRARPVT